jgi:hypothetical protein
MARGELVADGLVVKDSDGCSPRRNGFLYECHHCLRIDGIERGGWFVY